jgi:hypothetical protein
MGVDRLELGLRDVIAPEERRAERAGAVAAHEDVDVADVVRLEDNGDRRQARVEPLPHVARVIGRGERIEDQPLAARLDERRRDQRLPLEVRVPGGMLDPPEPEARRHVVDLHLRHRTRA